jgi:predicted glycosyltransferase involved in capsule biosynthesis
MMDEMTVVDFELAEKRGEKVKYIKQWMDKNAYTNDKMRYEAYLNFKTYKKHDGMTAKLLNVAHICVKKHVKLIFRQLQDFGNHYGYQREYVSSTPPNLSISLFYS